MVKDLIQTSLDTALYSKGIYVYEQRKSGADADEYVVYTFNGDNKEDFTDDTVLIKNATVTIKYYYRTEKLDNHASKVAVRAIEDLIENTLENTGFDIPFGRFDAGDIDDIGYHATIFECEYWRVV